MSDNTPTTTATWAQAQQASEDRQKATKTVVYNFGTKEMPVPASFQIKMLTQAEKDSIEERSVRIDTRARSDDKVKTDSTLLKRLLIQFGVVGGPAGWTGSKSDLDAICKDVALRDELAEAVDKFTLLDEETRVGFR